MKKYTYNFEMFGFPTLTVTVGGLSCNHKINEFFATNFGVTPESVNVDEFTGCMTVKANGCVQQFYGRELVEDDWFVGGYFGSRRTKKPPHKGDTGGFRSH